MKTKISKIFISLYIFLILQRPANAQFLNEKLKGAVKGNAEKFGTSSGFDPNTSVADSAALIIQVIFSIVGVIFICLLVYSGFLWLTARGNEEQVTKAKGIIRHSIWGIGIVITAYAVSYFVVRAITLGIIAGENPTGPGEPAGGFGT